MNCNLGNNKYMFSNTSGVLYLKGHGVMLYKYNPLNNLYDMAECGRLWFENGKCWVDGKSSTTDVERGDILEHTDNYCRDGLRRYEI